MPLPPDEAIPVLRIIDAAANRAAEGLRTVEDHVRFVLDDRHLTALAKQLRHELAAVVARIPTADRLAARETIADVGTGLTAAAEVERPDAASVAAAACQRAQQALRTVEEYAKLLEPAAAAEFKSLRYQTYTLHRAVATLGESLARLADARLYVLLDGRESADEMAHVATALVGAGVDLIQLRDKRLDDRELLARARRLREVVHSAGKLLIVNDRPDIARLAQVDGVHVGQEELSVKDVRTIVGPHSLIGVSIHSLAQARHAVLDGANYIGVGPTFPSDTKTFAAYPGLALLREVAAEVRLPAFAIGGITPENLPAVLAAGIRRVAVGSAIVAATDPAAVARRMREAVGRKQ